MRLLESSSITLTGCADPFLLVTSLGCTFRQEHSRHYMEFSFIFTHLVWKKISLTIWLHGCHKMSLLTRTTIMIRMIVLSQHSTLPQHWRECAIAMVQLPTSAKKDGPFFPIHGIMKFGLGIVIIIIITTRTIVVVVCQSNYNNKEYFYHHWKRRGYHSLSMRWHIGPWCHCNRHN